MPKAADRGGKSGTGPIVQADAPVIGRVGMGFGRRRRCWLPRRSVRRLLRHRLVCGLTAGGMLCFRAYGGNGLVAVARRHRQRRTRIGTEKGSWRKESETESGTRKKSGTGTIKERKRRSGKGSGKGGQGAEKGVITDFPLTPVPSVDSFAVHAKDTAGGRAGVRVPTRSTGGNGRQTIFHTGGDFAAFERVLGEGLARYPVDLLTYCLMGNHWHLVLRPREPGAMGRLMGWVGVTHVRRHHAAHGTRGGGHLYQGRFKSFPIAADDHLRLVLRYVEANARRAGLVARSADWPWGGLHARRAGGKPLGVVRLAGRCAGRLGGRGGRRPVGPRPGPAAAGPCESGPPAGAGRGGSRRRRPRWGLSSTLRDAGRPRKGGKSVMTLFRLSVSALDPVSALFRLHIRGHSSRRPLVRAGP